MKGVVDYGLMLLITAIAIAIVAGIAIVLWIFFSDIQLTSYF